MWHIRKVFYQCCFILCGLFVLNFVIDNYYQDNSNSYHLLSNRNISIEHILEQISICNSDDRPRQRSLLYTLQAWTHFAQQHHIRYWIAYGTLIGYVHRHGLLPHDPNIDLFIMANDTSQLLELSQSNHSSNYKLKVHPHWYLVGQSNRSYFYSKGIDFIAPNARFINSKDNLYLNIWPIYDYNPDEAKVENNSKAMLTAYDKNYKWKSSPKEWTFPLEECQFSGIKVWCPAEPEKLVNDIYGQISVNMSSRICINGSWAESDEYRSAKKKIEMNDESTSTARSTNAHTTSTSLNDYDLIEKALENISTCTSDDRPHQRILLTNLQAWARLAEKHNLQYWIAYGSLVGYVQRRGLLPHDGDTDVAMMNDDMPQLVNISQSNFSSKYKIKIQPQWKIIGYKNRAYFYDKGINFVGPNARFVDRETGNHVDIWPAYDFNPLYTNNVTEEKQSGKLTEYDRDYGWISYPRNWTYPLQICYFSDIKALCPAEPEKVVEFMYGVTALTESDTKCVNGSWVDND